MKSQEFPISCFGHSEIRPEIPLGIPFELPIEIPASAKLTSDENEPDTAHAKSEALYPPSFNELLAVPQ